MHPESGRSAWTERGAALLLLLASALLLFANLGDYALWQDEANAALLGKNILAYGVPRVFDGRNLILFIHSDVDASLTWRLWGWFPLYLNALAYAAFGVSTWGARFPYALMGLGFLAWAFARTRREKSFTLAALFIALNAFSVPLLLHFRQCQYYAPAIVFASLLFFLGEKDLGRPRTKAAFVATSFLLFHTQILIWMAALVGSGVRHLLSLRRGAARARALVATYLLALLFALPGVFVYRPWEFTSSHQTQLGFDGLAYLKKAIFDFANFVDPVYGFYAFAATAALLLVATLAFGVRISSATASPFAFCLAYFLFTTLASRNGYFRYFVPLIPVFLYGVALLVEDVFSRRRGLGWAFLALLLLTNVLHLRHSRDGHVYSVFRQYVHELTHSNSDVNEAIVGYLKQHSRPTDVVFTNYGAFPIIYYTQLTVGGGPTGYLLPGVRQRVPVEAVSRPDWILIRQSFDTHKDTLRRLLRKDSYERMTLPGVDTIWGNRPSPFYHHYATPSEGPPIELYRRRKDS
ncbi:MAG TPA: hypothetical protein VIY27_00220 [Myxococcota bacterium]